MKSVTAALACAGLIAFAAAVPVPALARPVVIEESAALTSPDPAWTFGRYGVAIDGDYALISGSRVVQDPEGEVHEEGTAFLYRRSGTSWLYQGRLGPIDTIPSGQWRAGLAMKNGVAVTWFDETRVFELQGDTWVRTPLLLPVENTTTGSDIEIDGARILMSRDLCFQSAVLRKMNDRWNFEGYLPGHNISCSAPWGGASEQDLHGTHAIVHNREGPGGEPAGLYLYRLNENGVGWRQIRFVPRVQGLATESWVAMNWPHWASTGPKHWGTAVGYEISEGVGALSRYRLQPADSYLLPEVYQISATGIERFRDGFAERNWSFDRDTHVINLYRINADGAHSSEHVATLQTSNGGRLGNLFDSSGDRMIVSGWAKHQGNDTVRIYDIPASLEAPPAQVHEFELSSDGAAWQPAAGSTFSVVRAGNTGVYRQASTEGNPSSSLTTSAANQAIQVEVWPRAIDGTSAWVGLTTRRNGSSYYYVTLRASGRIELKRMVNGTFTTLAGAAATFATGQKYRLRLESIGSAHRVYLDDIPVLTARDSTLREGVPGVMMYRAAADYDNVMITSSPFTTIDKHFFGDFSNYFEVWTETSGAWRYDSAGYHQTSLTGYGRAVTGARTDDQIVRARIRPNSFAGPDNWVGLMARYHDDRNHLFVTLRARGVVSLWRRTNGVITQLASRSMTVTPGAWYAVRVEVVSGRTRVFVNEQLQLATNADPGPTVPDLSESKGQVGLITYQATADFDDFLAYQP
jgi:hypothetical protein